MAKEAASTAIGPTALIAAEQFYPEGQRIIEDKLAYKMLPAGTKIFVNFLKLKWVRDWVIKASEKSQPGIWGGLLCRKRFIDEKLKTSENDFESIVNLGAGFDTRYFRLSFLSNMLIWEVDQQQNVEAKSNRLREIFGKLPVNFNLVKVDFDREDLLSALENQHYSISKRTFFIMEAVTQYLTENGIIKIFNFLSKASSGSYLTFNYVRKNFIEGKALYNWESGYKRFVSGNIWHYGIEPVELSEFLNNYGWRVIEDKAYAELADEYLKPSGRNLTSTPVERIVYAKKI